jgi:two-component system CheB/CheR fusion protein
LGKYFHKNGDSFQVARSVREMVVFARHNLISDPPFTKIDLISCRNLLIYLQPAIQQKVLEHFNFSLNAGGILFLGSSETVGDAAGYFEPVHHKFKIFRSVGKQSLTKATDFKPQGSVYNPYVQMRQGMGTADERVLERFLLGIEGDVLPLSAIVTEDLEVVHIFGDASPVFRIPSGRLSTELSSLARKGLAVLLTSLVQKAFRSGEQQETTVMVGEGESREAITIRVRLLPQRKGHPNLAALLFLPAVSLHHENSQTVVYDLSKESEERIRDLEAELQLTRENLQATIEELETSNEELQATNEELLASNEELQSTNEELQSTNEELHTVNTEYQNKIYELMALHHDIDNILNATGIGILLVDENKAIRRFSPPVTRIFSILDQDVGRPFTHITHNLEGIDLPALVDEVMAAQRPQVCEVRSRSGHTYHLQVSPYSVGPSDFAGVVLIFLDVTTTMRMRRELSQMERRLHEAMRLARLGSWVGHGAGFDQYWGEETFVVFGLSPKNAMPLADILELFEAEYRPLLHDAFLRLGKERTPMDMIARLRPELGGKWIRVIGRWEETEAGSEVRGVYQDVTHEQELCQRLAQLEREGGSGDLYRYVFHSLPHGAVVQDAGGRIVDANPAAEAILGRSLAAMQGRTSEDPEWRAIREDGSEFPGVEHPAMVALRQGRDVLGVVMGVWRPTDGQWVWIRVNAYPVRCNGSGRACRVLTIFEPVDGPSGRSEARP